MNNVTGAVTLAVSAGTVIVGARFEGIEIVVKENAWPKAFSNCYFDNCMIILAIGLPAGVFNTCAFTATCQFMYSDGTTLSPQFE